jgi:CspA family cold shock protein
MHRGDAQRITAIVKWFNRTKGFGFITANDGSGDVFLPAAVLAQAGHDEVGEGATITCDVSEGPKGRAVVNVLDVDFSTVAASRGPSSGPRGGGGYSDRGAGGGGYSDRGAGGGGYSDRGAGGGGYSDRGPRPDRGGGGGGYAAPAGPAEPLDGVVKWFDVARGFGFISPKDGGKDVFVHVSALRRSGLESLTTGQNVHMLVQEARRGREAASVELA